ncbi:MAG TPA: hypothetical protein VIM65_14600 [Cyclobacteriaceae bacterium]
MIRHFCFCLLLFSFISVYCLAQNNKSDSLPPRSAYHYIGIQSNQLFRQILNLSNTNTAIDNPYLLVYAVNSTKNGCGLNASVGLTSTEVTTGDASAKKKSDINDFYLRLGFEKKSMISKRWLVSWGIDILFEQQDDKTINTTTPSPGSSTKITTDTSNKAGGIGPRFTLNYKISDKIFIGTETSYYYKSGKNTSTVNFASTFNSQTTTSKTDSSEKSRSFQLAVPVALFVIVKF